MKWTVRLVILLASAEAASLPALLAPGRRAVRDSIPFVRDGLLVGVLSGYSFVAATTAVLDVVGRLRPRKRKRRAEPTAVVGTATVCGTWRLDPTRSDSMEPFLVAVGAPAIIARMVGKKGKPLVILIDDSTVTLGVERKEPEVYDRGQETPIKTPKGTVQATVTLEKAGRRLTIRKTGPRDGEHTTELRELAGDGSLRCTYTHHHPETGTDTTVTRVYVRS